LIDFGIAQITDFESTICKFILEEIRIGEIGIFESTVFVFAFWERGIFEDDFIEGLI